MHEHGLDNPRIIALEPNSKVVDRIRFPKGHLDGVRLNGGAIRGNYGIVLDGEYIVVDVDAPEIDDGLQNRLPVTWAQSTRKGRHYLFKVPVGWHGHNRKLRNAKGEIFGDLKSLGYIVGPGSVVAGHEYAHNGLQAVFAPSWVLSMAETPETLSTASEGGIAAIPRGSHHDFLVTTAGFLRGRHGLDQAALQMALEALVPLLDSPSGDIHEAIKHTAKTVNKYEAGSTDLGLDPTNWKSGLEIDTRLPIVDWWIHNFIPRGELCLVYGDGGIGKSTLASYVALVVLRKGGSFGVCSVEEPFVRFVVRVMLAMEPDEYPLLANLVDIGNHWKTPDTIASLREALEARRLDLVYFDAIKSHSSLTGKSGDASVLARAALSPLAALAQEMGITVLGTLHTNKLGDMSGSTEWANVPRIVLEATRKQGKPLRLKVKKTNFLEPDYDLILESRQMDGRSMDGELWQQRDDEGNLITVPLYVIESHRKSTGEDRDESQDAISEVDPRFVEINTHRLMGKSIRQIAVDTELSKSTIHRILNSGGVIQFLDLDDVDMLS